MKKVLSLFFVVIFLSASVALWGIWNPQKVSHLNLQKIAWQARSLILPNNPDTLLHKAQYLLEQDDYQRALDEMKKVFALESEGLQAANLPSIQDSRQRLQEIEALYSKIIAVDSDNVEARLLQAELDSQLQRNQNAQQGYEEVLAIRPQTAQAHLGLGRLKVLAAQEKSGIQDLESALQYSGNNIEIPLAVLDIYNEQLQLHPGHLLYEKAQRDAVQNYAEKILSSDDTDADSFLTLGKMYAQIRSWERALSAYNTVLDSQPHNIQALSALAEIYSHSDQASRAIILYHQVLELDNKDRSAHLQLGRFYAQQGQFEKAQSYFEELVQLDPKDSEGYLNLAYLYERQGRKSQAIEGYQKAIEFNSKNAEAYFNLGNIYFERQDQERATENYLSAVQVDPNHLDAWINLSVVTYEKKDFQNALKAYDEAVMLGYQAPQSFQKAMQGARQSVGKSL